ncbi:hypothetical protein CHS0354_040956 [Potamilus streckersoni]|uniref:Ig-like domain-containing protein n=1 Tax=Potamilus streckersoni TaxID=2493646 RepID=A0AAE0T810_9BIVA|nr:hypothetical protein CHS0354_040956 [Potamilus streckersoni]
MWFQVFVTLLSLTITCRCSTNIWFSANEYTGYVNDSTQLNCTVTGLLNEDIVIFSRKKTANDKEQILSTFEISKQATLIVSGIHISTVKMSSSDYLLVLAIDSVSCEDRGAYFCKVGDRQALARLIIWQKPDIPKFTVSKIIVEKRYMLAEHPLICEGEVGGPDGNIFVETYTNGSYNQYQYYPISRNISVSEDTCSTYLTLKFAVPGYVSLALNNTAMRCVATNNITLVQNMSKPASQTKRLYVVPATYCNGLINGNYRHPYECTMFIECSAEWVIADTCKTLCAHVEGMGKISCQNCSSVDCMDHESTSATTTARTTPAICSLDPDTPTMTLPSDIYENQRTNVVCTAQLGYPPGSLRTEINLNEGTALRSESLDIISKGNCSTIGRINLELNLNSTFNGSKILCIVRGPNNDRPSLFQEKIILIKSQSTASTTIKPREPHFEVLDMPNHIIGPLVGIPAVLLVAIVIAVVIHYLRERRRAQPSRSRGESVTVSTISIYRVNFIGNSECPLDNGYVQVSGQQNILDC